MRIGIVGAAGRMGRMNIKEVLNAEGATLAAALEAKGGAAVGRDAAELIGEKANGVIVTDDVADFISSVDAIIDFSTPTSTIELGKLAAEKGIVHVIGTTGLNAQQEEILRRYAKTGRIVYAPNFSIGVNTLLALVEKVAGILDNSYDIEIVEMHHNKKVDAPSGTALGLGKAAAAGRNVKLEDVWVKARDGHTGARKAGEIGFATLRGGDVVGDHTVMFATEGERVEITHKASDRAIFAKGAVRAAIWAKNQPAGLYSMKNVLGL
jgi:4-hydroxy-tetrahydrodipicolinate reductase